MFGKRKPELPPDSAVHIELLSRIVKLETELRQVQLEQASVHEQVLRALKRIEKRAQREVAAGGPPEPEVPEHDLDPVSLRIQRRRSRYGLSTGVPGNGG